MMYRLQQYTYFGSFETVMIGSEAQIEAYIYELANDLGENVRRIEGRFVTQGEWYYEIGNDKHETNLVYVVEEETC
jgi:hypothetical protein